MEMKILVIFLICSLVASVSKQLYDAKKNDGKITSDEVKSIMNNLLKTSLDMFVDLKDFKTIENPIDKKTYIAKKFAESIYNSNLDDETKEKLASNMDLIVAFVIANSDKILAEIETKK